MANYDTTIRVGTSVNRKGMEAQLMALEHQIAKKADKIASIMAKMGEMKDAKLPTQEYQEIASQIGKAEQKLNKLLEKQEQMQLEGKDNGVAWDRLSRQIEEANSEIKYAKGELQDLVDTGKAFTLGSDTEEFEKMRMQVQYLQNDVSVLTQKHERLSARLGSAAEAYKKFKEFGREAFNRIGSLIRKANNHIHSFGRKLKEAAQKHLPLFRKETERSKSALSGFGSRLKNLLSGIFIFNVISAGFRRMFSSISEGYQNLYNDNERFKSSVDSLKASFLTLKNTLSAAFSPIVEIAIPYIQNLVEWLTAAVNLAGQLIAALTGRKTYIKAVKQSAAASEEAAGAAEDEAEALDKQLSPLDRLNNLVSKEDKKDGGSSGGGIMFEEIPIADGLIDIADWLKDMWDKADFYDLGKLLGEKLKRALESIPWNKIKNTLRKIAKSIATFLNGFLEVPRLFYVIGETIAQGINSAFEFIDEFVWDFHWDSLGKAIMDAVRGVIDTLDWDVIASAVTGLAYGLADLLNTIFGETETWGDLGITIAKAINTAIHGLFIFIHNFDFAAFGTSIAKLLGNALSNIAYWKLGNVLATGINGAFEALQNFAETFPWTKLATNIANGINNALKNLDWEQIRGGLLAFASGLGRGLMQFIETMDWEEIGRTIGAVIQLAIDFLKTFIAEIDFSEVINAIKNALKGFMEEADMSEIALIILTLLASSLAISASKFAFDAAATSILGALKKALLGSEAVGSATAAGKTLGGSVASGFASALSTLAIVGGSLFGLEILKDNLEEIAEATGHSTDQAKRLEERYDGMSGNLTALKDGIDSVRNGLQGYGFAADNCVGQGIALEKAMNDIADGVILTDQRMSELQNRFSLTDEDMEMLRQEMLEANPLLREFVDNLGLEDASAETLQDIAQGFRDIANGAEPTPLALQNMTDEARNFIDLVCEGTNPMEVYGEKLANIGLAAENANEQLNLTGQSISDGITKGMEEADVETASTGLFNRIVASIKNVFGIHSPAENMKPLGRDIMLGAVEGFTGNIEQFTAAIKTWFDESVKPWFTKEKWSGLWDNVKSSAVEKFRLITAGITAELGNTQNNIRARLDSIKANFVNIFNAIKNTVVNIFNSLSSLVSGILGKIAGKVSSAAGSFRDMGSSFGSSNSRRTSQSVSRMSVPAFSNADAVIASLNNIEFPAYATGQVIPRTMKQRLAISGNNNRETEVASLLSAMKQTVTEAISAAGLAGGGTPEINLNLTVECEGDQLLHVMQKIDREYYKQHGRHALA